MISIVMAADKNYYYPMMTTIASILESKNPETEIEFHLFIDRDYTQEDKERINKFLAEYSISPANFIDVSESYVNVNLTVEHITNAAYYRLKIPSMLSATEKCLYLDVDTIVRTDLSDLYGKSMDDMYIMGVLAAGYQVNGEYKLRKAKELGIPSMDYYVNSGVLVMNLKRMRETNLQAIFDRLVQENFRDQDQDIINAACYGGIKLLPPEYNAMTKYEFEDDFYETDNAIPKCWSKWEWEKARTDPLIVHYADKDKPWTNFAVPFAKEWWHFAKMAGVAEESFNYYFDAHAANEEKICKLSNEKNRLCAECNEIQKKFDQTWASLIAVTEDHERAEAELKTQILAARTAQNELKALKGRTSDLERSVETLKKQNKAILNESSLLRMQTKQAQTCVAALKASNSYRLGRSISAPVRWLKRTVKKLKKA